MDEQTRIWVTLTGLPLTIVLSGRFDGRPRGRILGAARGRAAGEFGGAACAGGGILSATVREW